MVNGGTRVSSKDSHLVVSWNPLKILLGHSDSFLLFGNFSFLVISTTRDGPLYR